MVDKFIDRREDDDRQTEINRKKYLQRASTSLKEMLTDYLQSYIDVSQSSVKLSNQHNIKEYRIRYNLEDGLYYYMSIGNDSLQVGDLIKKDLNDTASGMGQGGDGSDDIHLSPEELEELLLGDLKLPNLKPKASSLKDLVKHRGGYTTEGTPAKLDKVRTVKESLIRKKALEAALQRKIKELEEELALIVEEEDQLLLDGRNRSPNPRYYEIQEELKKLKAKQVPLFEKHDLRYRTDYYEYNNITKAVIFFVMDISGSMTDDKRQLAKIGSNVLYTVLKRTYGANLESEFVVHDAYAYRVTAKEFFDVRTNGGTMLSSGPEMVQEIIKYYYSPSEYNIYIIQLSDGENFDHDNAIFLERLHDLSCIAQLYSFVAIKPTYSSIKLKDAFETYATRARDTFYLHTVDKLEDWSVYFEEIFT